MHAPRPQGRPQRGQRWEPPPPADLQQTLAFLDQLSAGGLPAMSAAAAAAAAAQPAVAQQQRRQQRRHNQFADGDKEDGIEDEGEAAAGAPRPPPSDLGVLLWGFFDRFGGWRGQADNWGWCCKLSPALPACCCCTP